MRGNPSIVSILMRSGTVGSEAQRRVVREQADYLIAPPMPGIGLRDWKKFDAAIQEGYDTARASIEKNGVPLRHVISGVAGLDRPATDGGELELGADCNQLYLTPPAVIPGEPRIDRCEAREGNQAVVNIQCQRISDGAFKTILVEAPRYPSLIADAMLGRG